jgi:hypothetical protein
MPTVKKPGPERNMDETLLEQGLQESSTTQQKVAAIMEAGVPARMIAAYLNENPRTVERWVTSNKEPRLDNGKRLVIEQMREILGILTEPMAMPPEEAAQWLTKPQANGIMPLELLKEHYEVVARAARNTADRRKRQKAEEVG